MRDFYFQLSRNVPIAFIPCLGIWNVKGSERDFRDAQVHKKTSFNRDQIPLVFGYLSMEISDFLAIHQASVYFCLLKKYHYKENLMFRHFLRVFPKYGFVDSGS